MSERSIRRAHERRLAKQQRRATVRRRRAGLVAGAAVGATALFAPSAQAANLVVETLADGPADAAACDPSAEAACKLRDAVANANANTEADTITFASGLSGTIRLADGEEPLYNDGDEALTIQGPGANVLTVSGDRDANGVEAGDLRILDIDEEAADTRISGLSFAGGAGMTNDGSTGSGGAIYAGYDSALELVDVTIRNSSTSSDGGGLSAAGDLTLTRTTFFENTAGDDGGGFVAGGFQTVDITDSEIRDNDSGGEGGGLQAGGDFTMVDSTVSGNVADGDGGGIEQKYGDLTIRDSDLTGNTAGDNGGGISLYNEDDKYSDYTSTLQNTTIAGNTAGEDGGGVFVEEQGEGARITVLASTLSGNKATELGGGLAISDYGTSGAIDVVNSTLSGNSADIGGAASIEQTDGEVEFANSTIANNSARGGGGLYLGSYGGRVERGAGEPISATVALTSTIVADNKTNADGPQDLDRANDSTSGGFDLAFSLVENVGDAPVFQSQGAANILAQDPGLGPLKDNGGPTETHVPSKDGPVIDKGDAPARLPGDQRGEDRTVDTLATNADNGDGTDIGAVEGAIGPDAPAPAASTPPPAQQPGAPTPPRIITRVRARLTQTLTPRTDTEAPFDFRVTGRLIVSTGLDAREVCANIGLVAVQIKRGKQTISSRRVQLRPDCTYSSSVSFKDRERLGRSRTLKFTVRYLGNQFIEPITNRSLTARVRPPASR